LFEYTTDGIFVLDAHGDILDINTRMCEILDVMKSTVLNKNLFNMDLLTARSLPIVIQQFEQLLSEKIAGSYTTEIKNRQGKVLEVEISSFFLVKKDNEVDNFVLIVRDITARTESEQKRSQEHELLHTLMDNISDLVYIKDEQHRFIMVNKAMAAEFHVDPEEMVGKTEFDFSPAEHAQRNVDDENAIMRSGQAIINRLECIGVDPGAERWMLLTKIPRYNEEGTIVGTIGFSRDVSLWKHTEEELIRNQGLLQTLMDNVPECVSFKDTQNRFILVNKQLANSFMVSPERMIGKSDFDFMPQDLAQKAYEQDNQILQTGGSIVNSFEKIRDAAGNERWISVTKVPRYDSTGRIIGTLSLSRDVTDGKDGQEMKPQ
ncbi:MAG: PAS domain-containing protein, partial [Candidatus Thermoplasmatota archaeon]|nr:PAS domain-containing protein [Candidatus Thermoplasmatota archaeon]